MAAKGDCIDFMFLGPRPRPPPTPTQPPTHSAAGSATECQGIGSLRLGIENRN